MLDSAQALQETLSEHPLPAVRYGFPDGWMLPYDLTVLYNLARSARGPVLEVGPWLGRSTTAIGLGLRDGHDGSPPTYDIVDFGITGPDEWERLLKSKFNPGMADGVAADAIYHPGGTNAVLVNNLKRNGLLEYATTVIRGDFLQLPIARRYSLIFCDAMHDEREAELYMPRLAELLAPGAILVLDDVTDRDFADTICGYLNVTQSVMTREVTPYCKLLVVQVA